MAGFDKIQITRDSKANIVANLDKLNEFEPILATDEKKLYTKIFGVLTDLTGLGTSDIVNDFNGGDGAASANIVKVLKGLVDVNTASLTNKLEKGSYTGDAQDLKNEIDLKTNKGNYTRTSQNIIEEVMGGEYGGTLNNTNLKTAGYIYYDTKNERNFSCIKNTDLDYANLEFFEDITNKELASKLKNLGTTYPIQVVNLPPTISTLYSYKINKICILALDVAAGTYYDNQILANVNAKPTTNIYCSSADSTSRINAYIDTSGQIVCKYGVVITSGGNPHFFTYIEQ